jgi:hypothetical protein
LETRKRINGFSTSERDPTNRLPNVDRERSGILAISEVHRLERIFQHHIIPHNLAGGILPEKDQLGTAACPHRRQWRLSGRGGEAELVALTRQQIAA